MNRENVLQNLEVRLQTLQSMIASVNKIELNTLYKFTEVYDLKDYESYGYFECYNRESARFVIIASSNPLYRDSKWRGRGYIRALQYVNLSETLWNNGAMIKAKVIPLADYLTRVAETDLPLLIGMKYRSPEYEKVLRGKKKLKYDKGGI
jgi:hypothetical protein